MLIKSPSHAAVFSLVSCGLNRPFPSAFSCPSSFLPSFFQLFRIDSWRTEDGETKAPQDSDDESKLQKQTVWRSFAEFKALHQALLKETDKTLGADFPRAAGWLQRSAVATSLSDFAECRRALLDNYLKAVLVHPLACNSRSLRTFLKPAEREDWPTATGDIDLSVHDLPHDSSQTEWWYYNCHFEDDEGKTYSAFAAFFRVVKHTDKDTGAKSYAHALNWALSDVSNKRYTQEIVLDKDSPAGKLKKTGRLMISMIGCC